MTAHHQEPPTMTSDEVIERAETAAINAVVSRWGSDGVAMMEVAKVAAKAAIAVLPPAGVGEMELAAAIYAADECDTIEEARLNIARFRKNLEDGRNAEHWGDCTKQCHTCIRCMADDYLKEARIIAALTTTEQGPTEPTNGDEG